MTRKFHQEIKKKEMNKGKQSIAAQFKKKRGKHNIEQIQQKPSPQNHHQHHHFRKKRTNHS